MISFRKSFMQRSLRPALHLIHFAVSIAFVSYLSVLFVRWWDSWMKLWDSRINYARVHLVEVAHKAYHATQVKVLRAHHGIQVEVLYAHHRWLILNGTLTFGDLIIFLGLLLLAAAIWTFVRAIYALERYRLFAYERELRPR